MGRETVLAGIDLEVAPGRLVVLRGSNGSGKTTLLRLLATRIRRSPLPGLDTLPPNEMPRYTVLVALHRQAEIVPELLVALGRLEWPRAKLEIKLV